MCFFGFFSFFLVMYPLHTACSRIINGSTLRMLEEYWEDEYDSLFWSSERCFESDFKSNSVSDSFPLQLQVLQFVKPIISINNKLFLFFNFFDNFRFYSFSYYQKITFFIMSSTKIRILILGDYSVGKTSLILRYIDKYTEFTMSTIGIDYYTKLLLIDKNYCTVEV